MRAVLAAAATLVLAGCALHPFVHGPAVPRAGASSSGAAALGGSAAVAPCVLPPAPAFPDTDAALAAAPGLADRVLRLREGRDARIAYERRLVEAVHGCRA